MKTALCMNDISAVGRCSLAVASPVFSAMGVQCCPLPTVLLSTHTGGFDPVVKQDQTEFLKSSLCAYTAQGLAFDSIVTGYFGSPQAVAAAKDYFSTAQSSLKVCDPVMADAGKLYRGFDQNMVAALRDLCHSADVITPNFTESALLLNQDPAIPALSIERLRERCCKLGETFEADVVITGSELADGTHVCAGFVRNTSSFFTLPCQYVKASYPGTGDLFCTVLTGALLAGNELQAAADLALHFTQKCVHTTFAKKTEPRFGVEFEVLLPELEATLCR